MTQRYAPVRAAIVAVLRRYIEDDVAVIFTTGGVRSMVKVASAEAL